LNLLVFYTKSNICTRELRKIGWLRVAKRFFVINVDGNWTSGKLFGFWATSCAMVAVGRSSALGVES